MTYKEALDYKSTLPQFPTIESSGYLAKFYVVPENNEDLIHWLKNFNQSKTTDETAKNIHQTISLHCICMRLKTLYNN